MAIFEINYEQVTAQANIIDILSGDLNTEIQNLENIFNSIGSDWEGPASTEYQKHLKKVVEDMYETKKSMSGVALTIKDIVTRVKQEDERQAELAKLLPTE